MGKKLDKFAAERERLNELVQSSGDVNIKRFFALDNAVYRDGAFPAKIKELMGLVASSVLRCDTCITFHVERCFSEGIAREEFDEAMGIVLVVGGSITIPHVRRAYDFWEEMENDKSPD